MTYEKFHYEEVKGAPEYLRELGIKPVFIPRQDGYLKHYAFLDKNESEVFACGELNQLVKEADRRLKKSNEDIHKRSLLKKLFVL